MESSTLRQAQGRLWYAIKQRLAWIKMHERGAPVTAVCQHYGIGLPTYYTSTLWPPRIGGFGGESQVGLQNHGFIWARIWVDDLK